MGHGVSSWSDPWWSSRGFPELEGPVVFHGSLQNAAQIAEARPELGLPRWSPGAYCGREGLRCRAWYPQVAELLVDSDYMLTTVDALCRAPEAVAGALADGGGEIFVRPDSPLKPFSGRVVALAGLSPATLDYGFYYDDLALPIVVMRRREVGREWRLVVVDGSVVTGCGYAVGEHGQGREAGSATLDPAVLEFAAKVIAALTEGRLDSVPPLDRAYVLDVGEVEGALRLVELNPFSGADLYGCDLRRVAEAIAVSAE